MNNQVIEQSLGVRTSRLCSGCLRVAFLKPLTEKTPQSWHGKPSLWHTPEEWFDMSNFYHKTESYDIVLRLASAGTEFNTQCSLCFRCSCVHMSILGFGSRIKSVS